MLVFIAVYSVSRAVNQHLKDKTTQKKKTYTKKPKGAHTLNRKRQGQCKVSHPANKEEVMRHYINTLIIPCVTQVAGQSTAIMFTTQARPGASVTS